MTFASTGEIKLQIWRQVSDSATFVLDVPSAYDFVVFLDLSWKQVFIV